MARNPLTGLENGESEVLADPASRALKAALSGPVEGLTMRVVDGNVVLGAATPA